MVVFSHPVKAGSLGMAPVCPTAATMSEGTRRALRLANGTTHDGGYQRSRRVDLHWTAITVDEVPPGPGRWITAEDGGVKTSQRIFWRQAGEGTGMLRRTEM